MNDNIKDKASMLINELLALNSSEEREDEIMLELNSLLPDPNWSDYIFWSEDYKNKDDSINYEKFFNKVFGYIDSEEYRRKEKIIHMVHKLINNDFNERSEIDIINEINELLPNVNWIDYIFTDQQCLNPDGSLNEKLFLDKVF